MLEGMEAMTGPRRSFTAAVILLLLLPAASHGLAEDGEDVTFYQAHLVETGEGLGAAASGSPPTVRYNVDGSKVLLLGYASPDEVRILDADLETLAILEPPSPGFSVKGAEIDHWGRHAYVWGRSSGAASDTAHVYSLTNYTLRPNFLPSVTPTLVEIDYVRPMTDDNYIVAMAGHDVNGTSRFLVFERDSGGTRTDDAIEGGRSVVFVGTDGHDMVVLVEGGRFLVYETGNWKLNSTVEISDDEVTYWHVWDGDDWIFADDAGIVYFYHQVVTFEPTVVGAARGPISGVQYGQKEYDSFLVVAIPGKKGGSSLELFIGNRMEYKRYDAHPTEKAIAWMHRVAGDDDTIAVVFEDGSLAYYRMEFTERKLPQEEERGMGLSFWVSMFLIAVLIVVVLVLLVRSRR